MDAGSCTVRPRRVVFSSGCGAAITAHLVVPALCLVPLLSILLLPWMWRMAGATLGWYLRRKTEGRRWQILEAVGEDEKRYEARGSDRKGGTGDEWESVEAYAAGSAGNGEKGQEDWDGIVGFFHPFW